MTDLKNRLKKGFTLVELSVVIAVIAILVAVLVPTFITLIDNANESKDTQTIYNVNLALSTEKDNIKSVSDALDIAAEAGYNIDKLTPSSDGEIVYDHATKSFALISTEGEVIYPTSNSSLDLNAPTTYYFVDEATYTALNTTTSASASSYSLAKASIKSATAETANTSTTAEHTVSYIAKGEWTGEFSYTGMGAIDTTRATGITSVSYTSKTVKGYESYELNVAYYISESNSDDYSLTVNITESGDYTIYCSPNIVRYVLNVADNIEVTLNIESTSAAIVFYDIDNTNINLTVTVDNTDVTTEIKQDIDLADSAVVENGVLQLGTEKYPWLISTEEELCGSNDISSKLISTLSTVYVKITKDIELTDEYTVGKITSDIVINGDNHTISRSSSTYSLQIGKGTGKDSSSGLYYCQRNITINNLNFKMGDSNETEKILTIYGNSVSLIDCTFESENLGVWGIVISKANIISISNSETTDNYTFKNAVLVFDSLQENAEINISDVKFYAYGETSADAEGIYLKSSCSEVTLNLVRCSFTGRIRTGISNETSIDLTLNTVEFDVTFKQTDSESEIDSLKTSAVFVNGNYKISSVIGECTIQYSSNGITYNIKSDYVTEND